MFASVGQRLKDVQGDGHCGIHSIVDQLQQQGLHVTMQSVRTDTAAWLSDKQYAWSQYPQDDACNWETFVQQVGHTGPVGFWVNHIVFAAVACRYNCDLTIIQSMPDDTHALVPLSGKTLALNLTDEHYDETTQWRHHNAPGDVAPLFLAQKGLEHFMSTELLSTPQSILPPRSVAGAGAGQGGARVAGLSGRAPSGMPSAVDSSIETGRIGGGIAGTEDLTLGKEDLKEAPVTALSLLDPVALLHALATWFRLLCCLEILVI